MPPGRVIALAFLAVILIGTLLLWLPISQTGAVRISLLDSLFTATSAVCVTGLVVADTATAFTVFGRTVIAVLIQIGGFGAATLGIMIIVIAGRRVNLKHRALLKEAWNINSYGGLVILLRRVFLITLVCEAAGALLFFCFFIREYPLFKALGIAVFHSISTFNNAGFDILGSGDSLIRYSGSVYLNIITAAMIIISGVGFAVLVDIGGKRRFSALNLQSKIVLTMTAVLIVGGTLLLKLTEGELSWLEAFFQSVTARTAGFATVELGSFKNAPLLIMCVLMFIGASPGGTGGGVKTTTVFAVLLTLYATATHSKPEVFRRRIAEETTRKAFTILSLSVLFVLLAALVISAIEPQLSFISVLFESVSAFATVGLTTGVTPLLSGASRVVLIITMFIGRIGPMTAASLWVFRQESAARYTDESFNIG